MIFLIYTLKKNNEIFVHQECEYKIHQIPSEYYKNDYNYEIEFKSKSNTDYVIDFILVKETQNQFKDGNVFNFSFTLKQNHNLNNSNVYEEQTNRHEYNDIVNRILFILTNVIPKIEEDYPNLILLLGETVDVRKIRSYRNIINETLPQYIEIEDKSEFTNNLKAYYYINGQNRHKR